MFARDDPAAWLAQHDRIDVHGDAAYTFSTYTETLVPREGSEPSRRVVGRFIAFLRRDAAGTWGIELLMNAHSRPIEEVPAP